MDKLKKFIFDNKIIITIILFLLASFLIYKFVFAEDEVVHANYIKAEVTGVTVESGSDTVAAFDADDAAGNDSSKDNTIVRTFDKIKYEVKYNLKYKEDSELVSGQTSIPADNRLADSSRKVGIDVLLPATLITKLTIDSTDPQGALSPVNDQGNPIIIGDNDNRYVYYHFEKTTNLNESSAKFDVYLNDIYAKNGYEIKPIIRVREMSDLTPTEINASTQISQVTGADLGDEITVSAKEDYALALYQGSKGETTGSKTPMPLGIVAYLPKRGAKGIVGLNVPDTINTNIKIVSNLGNSVSSANEDFTISTYNPNPSNDSEKIIIRKSEEEGATPEYMQPDGNNNATASIGTNKSINGTDNASSAVANSVSTIPITINGMVFNPNKIIDVTSVGSREYFFASKVFTFKSQRPSGNKTNITYSITAGGASNSITDYEDNYVSFVGDYESTVNFFTNASAATGSTDSDTTPDYLTTINYNEDFYISNNIAYGNASGDPLNKGFTQYIKIDNSAIKISESPDFPVVIRNGVKVNFNLEDSKQKVAYGVGNWSKASFQLNTGAPSYCSLTDSTKNTDLMNYYGGPCLNLNNGVTWYNSISEIPDTDKNNIILIRYTDEDVFENGSTTKIILSAKARNIATNIGQKFMVVTRGVTNWNNSTYYLSPIPKVSADNLIYNMATYDSNYNRSPGNSTANGTNVTPVGNTLLISPFKAFINDIKTEDAYESEKDTFYSGITDPIEFQINPVIYKSSAEAEIKNAYVDVYLPNTLEIYVKPGDKMYSSTSTSGDYNVYRYTYTKSDIMFKNKSTGENSTSGTIDALLVHAYISPNVQDNKEATVKAVISGILNPNIDMTTTYGDMTPESDRTTTKSITLMNTTPINSIGKTDKIRIDKNGSYDYNIRSYNNTDTSADLSLLYILPYKDDGFGSNFSGTTSVSILGSLPAGYSAYYTTDAPQALLTSVVDDPSSVNWQSFSNINTPLSNATAIRITAPAIAGKQPFATPNGITFRIKTSGNKELEKYFNKFYMIQANASVCDDDNCTHRTIKPVPYMSNISEVSVYNRTISGYAFEDENYNGFYDNKEKRLGNVSVDLYKLSVTDAPSYDQMANPIETINNNSSELVSNNDTTTNYRGYYKFSSLESGYYYVRYGFNCDKYTVTDKNKEDIQKQGDTTLIDSDAQIIEKEEIVDEESGEKKNVCYAVSNILALDNNKVEHKHIDLGLKVREDFDIKMNKYITNVKVFSNGSEVQNNNYNNQSKVKVDVKNLKNTSFRVTYGIEIENTKYFPGTIGTIIETIPAGMTFNPNYIENDGWQEYNGRLYYNNLSRTLIMPGEKYHLKIVLDLQTDTGGNYINIVAAGNLKIKPAITNFLDVPEDNIIIDDETGREAYEDDDNFYYYDDEEYYDFDVDYTQNAEQYDEETDEEEEDWEDE